MGRRRVKVFFDGGCRPNPGQMEVAVVLRGVAHVHYDLGFGTSSDAEWLALIRALELALKADVRDAELIGDSLDVINRARKVLDTGQATCAHEKRLWLLLERGRPARIRWIRREQNLAGIALAARHRT